MSNRNESHAWAEYDYAARWCALRKIPGGIGDELPANLGSDTLDLINEDPGAFTMRVREVAYTIGMEALNLPDAP